jgi:hypothetical protein
MDEQEVEARLASARPEPSEAFVEQLECTLFGAPRALRRKVWRRRLLLALSAGAACAGVLVAFALAGASPLGGDSGVQADPRCTVTVVPTIARVPTVVPGADGRGEIVLSRQHTTQAVRICPGAADRRTAP